MQTNLVVSMLILSAAADTKLSLNMDSRPQQYVTCFQKRTMKETLNERLSWLQKLVAFGSL